MRNSVFMLTFAPHKMTIIHFDGKEHPENV